MPVTIDEVVAEVEPSTPDERVGQPGSEKKPSRQMEARRLESFIARLERRKQRVRAD